MPTFRTNPSPMTYGVPRRPRPIVPREERETLEEHDAAQAAIEFATLRRQADETMNAALREAEEAPDESSASKILEVAKAGVFKLQSKNIRVQNAFSAHVEGSLPGWEDRFARQTKAAGEKRIHDKGLQEYEAALDAGDLVGAVKITEHLKTIEPENASIYDKMASDAPNASALRQVRRAVAEGNLGGAKASIEEARKLELSVEQKEDLKTLAGVVDRGERERVSQGRVELLTEADKTTGLPDVERFMAIEQIKARYAQIAESPEDLRATFNWLDSIAEGKPFKVDPQAEIEANDIVRTLTADSTPQENAEARDKILALAPRLGPRAYDFIKELGTRLDTAKTYAVNAAVDDLVARKVIDKFYADVIRRQVEKHINEDKGPFDPWKVYSFTAGLAVMVPEEARPEAKLPPVELSNILGQLKARQTQWTPFGPLEDISTRADAVRLIVQKIWYDPRLTDENRTQLRVMLDAEYSGNEQLPLLPGETPTAAGVAARTAKGAPTLPVVKTDEDYDALESGAEFEDENGKPYRKP